MGSSTVQGEQIQAVSGGGEHPDPKQRDDAAAKMASAPVKGFEDLPDDHPMARRAAAMAQIEAANEAAGADKEEAERRSALAINAADPDAPPPLDIFKDKPAATSGDTAAQVAVQTEDRPAQTVEPTVLEDLTNVMVRVKIDGVDQLVPATKALAQYQKGAAADVRLAEATRIRKDAEAFAAAAQAAPKDAPAATAPAAPAGNEAVAAKLKEAGDALYSGDVDRYSRLQAEALALASAPPSPRDATVTTDDLVGRVTSGVEQQLLQKGALKQLFEDYPEIRKHSDSFGVIADKYAAAFMANGDDVATAIFKAGEAVGEEFGLGKWNKSTPAADRGRPLNSGGPTTREAKLSAKQELDNIQSSNVRAASTEAPPMSVAQELEEMRKSRPGYIPS